MAKRKSGFGASAYGGELYVLGLTKPTVATPRAAPSPMQQVQQHRQATVSGTWSALPQASQDSWGMVANVQKVYSDNKSASIFMSGAAIYTIVAMNFIALGKPLPAACTQAIKDKLAAPPVGVCGNASDAPTLLASLGAVAGVTYKVYASPPMGPMGTQTTKNTTFLKIAKAGANIADILAAGKEFVQAHGRAPWPGDAVVFQFTPVDDVTGVGGVPIYRSVSF
jgi:hypothetical protein